MDKKVIRKNISEKRDNLIERETLDRKIIKKFINLKEYKEAENICIYVNYKSEINTKEIIKISLEKGKSVFVPRIKKNREMDFIKINSLEDLEENKMGILEPKDNFNKKPDKIDLMILPGLAFDLNGGRIGYGGGYYDRYLMNKNEVLKISLCYEIQIIDKIPMEEHDIEYDYLITENRALKRK